MQAGGGAGLNSAAAVAAAATATAAANNGGSAEGVGANSASPAAQLSAAAVASNARNKMLANRAVTGRPSLEMRSTRAGLASDVWSFGCLAYEVGVRIEQLFGWL